MSGRQEKANRVISIQARRDQEAFRRVINSEQAKIALQRADREFRRRRRNRFVILGLAALTWGLIIALALKVFA